MVRKFFVIVVAAAAMAMGVAAEARPDSLPDVSVGPRPGPDILYADPVTTPQLENAGIWRADPLMVSGADAYAGGEYLYQDFIYDDYGANTTNGIEEPSPVPLTTDVLFGPMTGDVAYPTDTATYVHNAADLLEVRARPVPDHVAYRFTLNSMTSTDVAAVALGIDTDRDASTGRSDWGYGLGSLGPLGLEHVAVSWGTGGEFDGRGLTTFANLQRRQIDMRVPLSAGRGSVWRHYVVVGLFDTATKAFKPIGDQPTATHPGGAHGTNPPPVFNVGFRFDEPMGPESAVARPEEQLPSGSRAVGFGHWRDHGQALALAARDISAFHADIDFGKIADGVHESHVPESGYLNRLFVSQMDLGQGKTTERPMLRGPIQPYSVYIPESKPKGGYSLHVVLHSLSCNYNQYGVLMPRMLEELGEGRGAVVLTTLNRGPDGWYHDEAEVDLFEAWADVARNYDLNADRATLSGYSMGGYGTYKIASQYPDLFSRGFTIVGPADENLAGGPTGGMIESAHNTLHIADNLRNVPLLMWNGLIDELVPVAGVVNYEQRLHDLGYRHELDVFPTHDHFLFGLLDEWGAAVPFLAEDGVDRDPAHVTYRAMPEMDNAALGLVHDHAYWVSDIAVTPGARSGLVDVRSLATGADTPRLHGIAGAGLEPRPHVRRGLDWGPGGAVATANRLVVDLSGTAAVTFWIERAGIDTDQPVELVVNSNGPATITLSGRFGSVAVPVVAGRSEHRVRV